MPSSASKVVPPAAPLSVKVPPSMDIKGLQKTLADKCIPERNEMEELKYRSIIEDIAKMRVGQYTLAAAPVCDPLYNEVIALQKRLLGHFAHASELHVTCQVVLVILKAVADAEARLYTANNFAEECATLSSSGQGSAIPGFRAIISMIALFRIVQRQYFADPSDQGWETRMFTLQDYLGNLKAGAYTQAPITVYVLDLFSEIVAKEAELQECFDPLLRDAGLTVGGDSAALD
ncbi:hypothetical protein NMY22_g15356 [Coprinellus aureogranulatus]|nr:hypothetical protein NMY22_g15356 [Coprinellus aureogranulatus]